MDESFLKAIVICLLSKRFELPDPPPQERYAPGQSTPQKPENPKMQKQTPIKPKRLGYSSKNEGTLKTAKGSAGSTKAVPSYISGYKDGVPIRTFIRVVPLEVVDEIEANIAMEEREEAEAKQSSTATLYINDE